MKNYLTLLCLGVFVSAVTAHASSIPLGLIGTEPGTPIAGEEDVIVYNNTGPVFGCSSSAGSPICTPVIFDDVVLTINGAIQLELGNIGPGFAETATYSGGVFIDGSIKSLSLTTSLSTTNLVTDLHSTYEVDSAISLSGIPTDGSLDLISARQLNTPEPSTLPVLLPIHILLCLALLTKRVKQPR